MISDELNCSSGEKFTEGYVQLLVGNHPGTIEQIMSAAELYFIIQCDLKICLNFNKVHKSDYHF